jgi:hypothetical protein
LPDSSVLGLLMMFSVLARITPAFAECSWRQHSLFFRAAIGDFIGIVFRMRVVKAFTDTPIGDDAMISKIEPIERHGGETARSAGGSIQILAR